MITKQYPNPNINAYLDVWPSQPGRCSVPQDWIDLAVAALDKAGFSVHTQHLIEDELNSLAQQEKLEGFV